MLFVAGLVAAIRLRPSVAHSWGDEETLVQRSATVNADHDLRVDQPVAHRSNQTSRASWVTGPYGSCKAACGKKTRQLSCKAFPDGTVLLDGVCAGKLKPASSTECNCALELCVQGSEGCAVRSEPAQTVLARADRFEAVGCYKLSPGDSARCPEERRLDQTCLGHAGPGACRSGLAFFRECGGAAAPEACAAFCLARGMDVAGIADSKECRCGASALNQQVWRNRAPRPGLAFSLSSLDAADEGSCPLRVLRYAEPYPSGGVSIHYREDHVASQAYVDGIVAGHAVTPEEEEEGQPLYERKGTKVAMVGERKADPKWTRSCYPSNCASGRGPWQSRTSTAPAGIDTKWQDYVIVTYHFFDSVVGAIDDATKEAFRAAAEVWHNVTCIVFEEVGAASAASDPNNHITVTILDPSTCFTNGVGRGITLINVGSCNGLSHKGTIIHELGHALGMTNEQRRADAQVAYHGHGPHLTIHWENVPSGLMHEYTTIEDSYIGSADDGPGDPHPDGYANYDFDSIMHAPAGIVVDTIPPSFGSDIGQRSHLSSGDIEQVLDMYQCKLKISPTPAPSTTAAAQQAPSTTVDTPTQGPNYAIIGGVAGAAVLGLCGLAHGPRP